jgi:hypothetical protein
LKSTEGTREWTKEDLSDLPPAIREVFFIISEQLEESGPPIVLVRDEINAEILKRGYLDAERWTGRGSGALFQSISLRESENDIHPKLFKGIGKGMYEFNLHYRDIVQDLQVFDGPSREDEIRNVLIPVEKILRQQIIAIDDLQRKHLALEGELATANTLGSGIRDAFLKVECESLLHNPDMYVDTIRRTSVVLEDRIRLILDPDPDGKNKFGAQLIDYAFDRNDGQLIISTNPADQEGFRLLLRGVFGFIRNPVMHNKRTFSSFEVDSILGIVDYLLFILEAAEKRDQ